MGKCNYGARSAMQKKQASQSSFLKGKSFFPETRIGLYFIQFQHFFTLCNYRSWNTKLKLVRFWLWGFFPPHAELCVPATNGAWGRGQVLHGVLWDFLSVVAQQRMDATSTQGCQNPPLSWTQALPRSASLPEVAASRHVQRVQANRCSPACCPPRTRIPPSAGIKLLNERRIKILYGGPREDISWISQSALWRRREAATTTDSRGSRFPAGAVWAIKRSRCASAAAGPACSERSPLLLPGAGVSVRAPGPGALPQPDRADWRGALWALRRRSGPCLCGASAVGGGAASPSAALVAGGRWQDQEPRCGGTCRWGPGRAARCRRRRVGLAQGARPAAGLGHGGRSPCRALRSDLRGSGQGPCSAELQGLERIRLSRGARVRFARL